MTRMRQSALWLMTWLEKKGMNALLVHVHQTFLSLLVSFLLSHRSLSFISYNNVLHFPLDTIPQRIMGLLGNLSWWMCACVSVFHLQIFRIIFLSNHLKISKIWGFIWLLDIHVSHRAGVSEGHRKGDAPTLKKKERNTKHICLPSKFPILWMNSSWSWTDPCFALQPSWAQHKAASSPPAVEQTRTLLPDAEQDVWLGVWPSGEWKGRINRLTRRTEEWGDCK